MLSVTFAFASLTAFAGDGAENSTIYAENTTYGLNMASSGEVKATGVGSVKAGGEANAGTIKYNGSAKNSTIYMKNTTYGLNMATGNANAGSIIIDTTNNQ